jgi:phage baseplate assembly protein W
MTLPGERPFAPVLGSNVSNLLFENFDELTASAIKSEIRTTLDNYEPRIELNSVKCEANYDNHEYNVTISYYIVGIDVPQQELTFALLPTR